MMRLRDHFIALAAIALIALSMALSPTLAAAGPINWVRYQVPETGASVDIPASIFTEDAGKPEDGYGSRFLTSDQRADLTIHSGPEDPAFSHAEFLATD